MSTKSMLAAITSMLAVAACQPSAPSVEDIQLKSADPVSEDKADPSVWSHGAMVAAADPRAVEAGLNVLRAGGHAVDAAIAAHAVLGLVEPESSGLGGGAFMVVFDRARQETVVYDGRETAPAAIDENLFMEQGRPLSFVEAWQSGHSAGAPGTVALYGAAHAAHGELVWASLFQEAIQHAEAGFTIGPKLAAAINSERIRQITRLDDHPASAAYFYPDGQPLQEGDLRDNPAYAETLRLIAAEGPGAFYRESIPAAIEAVISEPPRPGRLSAEDISAYEVRIRPALCGPWRTMTICSAPPPSSGGITQNMIARLYDELLPVSTEDQAVRLQAFVDAQRLAYADRDHYVADADWVQVPAIELIHPDYLKVRASQRFAPAQKPTPGDPGEVLGMGSMIGMWGQDPTIDKPGTTHLSVIDSAGNAVAMTATIESAFGNARMVKGFLMNNELTDFAFEPTKNSLPVANAPAPLKRPRSSMSPTIVFDEKGEVKLVTGSPGGNSIVAYTAKTLIGILDWGMSPQQAIDFPNIVARGERVSVEVDRPGGAEIAELLRQKGYSVRERRGGGSGLHTILVTDQGLLGGADPRRDGIAKALD